MLLLMKKIVLTGGPCSGKTTTIQKLNKLGFLVINEIATEVILERQNIPLSKEEFLKRQDLIFERQLFKEKEYQKGNNSILFLDRGLIDGLAYTIFYAGEEAIKKYDFDFNKKRYDLIFSLEQLPFAKEGFRIEDSEEEARRIHRDILNLYEKYGYELIFVPKMTVEERVGFILDKVFDGGD